MTRWKWTPNKSFFVLVSFVVAEKAGASQLPSIRVEVEEAVTTCASPNNGAGPLWCYGAPLIARVGDEVFASAMQTGKDVPPLCNTRWRLFRRDGSGWKIIKAAADFREREPCPVVALAGGDIFLSINPSTQPPGTKYGQCEPQLLRFPANVPQREAESLRPVWADGAFFTDHSYRGIGADAARRELLMLNIHARTGEYFWSLRDASGNWSHQGRVGFPIRACYPQVALRNRAAHVLAIGDIVEPNAEWRKYKREKTKRDWDYVFRRLFYTWTPDITRSAFAAPLELDTVDATAGHITNLDLWIGDDGAAHVLYLKDSIASTLMRDRFFPGTPIVTTLEYIVLKDGKETERRTLLRGGEGIPSTPGFARLHATGDGRLFAVLVCTNSATKRKPTVENRILQILPFREGNRAQTIKLKEPFHRFFTAAERGGSEPSRILDLFGTGSDSTVLRYARVRID